jgi:hypothetical protein
MNTVTVNYKKPRLFKQIPLGNLEVGDVAQLIESYHGNITEENYEKVAGNYCRIIVLEKLEDSNSNIKCFKFHSSFNSEKEVYFYSKHTLVIPLDYSLELRPQFE